MFKTITLFIISYYQKGISPFLPNACRFEPSCSEYTRQAVIKYGPWTGLVKGLRRLLICHPFSRHFGEHPLE